jgi:hypothetical protein
VKRAVSIDHPRWLVWVTFASILAPLPSALWRLGLATGLSMGSAVSGSGAWTSPAGDRSTSWDCQWFRWRWRCWRSG